MPNGKKKSRLKPNIKKNIYEHKTYGIEITVNKDAVNHPPHYTMGKFEVIDIIEDWKLNFNLGNSVKYIARSSHKGNKITDLEKSMWYLQREIDNLKKGEIK